MRARLFCIILFSREGSKNNGNRNLQLESDSRNLNPFTPIYSVQLKNKQHHLNVLLNRFHLNGHTLGFHRSSQTILVEPYLLTRGWLWEWKGKNSSFVLRLLMLFVTSRILQVSWINWSEQDLSCLGWLADGQFPSRDTGCRFLASIHTYQL